jgi:hypothetical protein
MRVSGDQGVVGNSLVGEYIHGTREVTWQFFFSRPCVEQFRKIKKGGGKKKDT